MLVFFEREKLNCTVVVGLSENEIKTIPTVEICPETKYKKKRCSSKIHTNCSYTKSNQWRLNENLEFICVLKKSVFYL